MLWFFFFFFPSPFFFSHYSVQSHPCSQACVIMEMPELFYKRESWSFITWKQRGRMQHQIQNLSNLWSLKIYLKFILFPYNCRVRRKRDWLWLFKRPAISCHLPRKNQMQGNKRVMGNFNLNKWAHLCCALALNLGSELTHSWFPSTFKDPTPVEFSGVRVPWSLGESGPLFFLVMEHPCLIYLSGPVMQVISSETSGVWGAEPLSPAKIRRENSSGVSSWENSEGQLLIDLSLAAGSDYGRLS